MNTQTTLLQEANTAATLLEEIAEHHGELDSTLVLKTIMITESDMGQVFDTPDSLFESLGI